MYIVVRVFGYFVFPKEIEAGRLSGRRAYLSTRFARLPGRGRNCKVKSYKVDTGPPSIFHVICLVKFSDHLARTIHLTGRDL